MVAQWLAHLPLVLDVPGSISAGCEEYADHLVMYYPVWG